MKYSSIVVLILLSISCLAGCASSPSRPQAVSEKMASVYEKEDLVRLKQDYARLEVAARDTEAQFLTNQEQLNTVVSALKRTEAKAEQEQDQLKRLADLLQINDNIVERKSELLQQAQGDFAQKKESYFAAMGGRGTLEQFKLEDMFVYKGSIGVTMRFLWSNTDGSGGVARGYLAFTPDEKAEISGCSMLGQKLFSAQELASFNGGSSGQLEQTAAQIEKRPESNEEPKMSEQTKNTLIQGGVTAGIMILEKLLSDN